MYDVAIIGAGIVGASVARELSKYRLKVCLVEKENDVSEGTTKANSALVHAGYDPEEGTRMARLNVRGCALTEILTKELSVPYRKIGSLVVAFNDADMETVRCLYGRGLRNGVPGLEVLGREELRKLEPGIAEEAVGALHAPSAGIVGPWEFCIALAENAVVNGVTLFLDTEVVGMVRMEDRFQIETSHPDHRRIEAGIVVNAAGVNADEIMAMAGKKEFEIFPRKGQYFILDKNQGSLVSHIIFQCPSDLGKGVVVTPTVHGNLLVGPDSEGGIPKEDRSTTKQALDLIRTSSEKSVKTINFRENIRNFAGIRAYSDREDFIIEESQSVRGLINLAGIKSPGLTSAPAIAEEVVEILAGMGTVLVKKDDFIPSRQQTRFMELPDQEKAERIRKDNRFGRVICRCESITEGEIIEAIKRPVGAVSLDGVKRRVRPGMGRCQGGFCGPRVQEILARELGTTMEEIEQDTRGSYILIGETKKGGEYDGV